MPGSPPRMRGKLVHTINAIAHARITPADAGKTPALTGFIGAGWDHPRGCGENIVVRQTASTTAGSPPRMRGKPIWKAASGRGIGITPADAGKTSANCRPYRQGKDHPRGCGENYHAMRRSRSAAGSPPRMRGKPSSGALADAAGGITPADAGKTKPHCRACRQRQDHPRGCGENAFRGHTAQSGTGSPPRMRGKP